MVAPLAPKRHIMSNGYRYSEATRSIPITTMTNECGIGMSAGGFENHWRMNVLVCQRSNVFFTTQPGKHAVDCFGKGTN